MKPNDRFGLKHSVVRRFVPEQQCRKILFELQRASGKLYRWTTERPSFHNELDCVNAEARPQPLAYPLTLGGVEAAAWGGGYYRRGVAFHG